jgi:hypothetical protein
LLISDIHVHNAATAADSNNSIKKLLFLEYILVEFTKYLPTAFRKSARHLRSFKKIIIIIIFINCNWVITRWQWLFYMYTNMGGGQKLGNLRLEGYMRGM